MTKTPIPIENSKTIKQHKNATKKFDYKNDSHPTGVVKHVQVNGYPTLQLTAKRCIIFQSFFYSETVYALTTLRLNHRRP